MKSFLIQSPTRVDLAGGTLDLWPLYLFVGGATTVNVAIDLYTKAELTPLATTEIELISEDLGLTRKFSSLMECLIDPDPRMNLLNVQLKYWRPLHGFRLTTSSMSPVGGGLGASSSLTISLLKAFQFFCGKQFVDTHDMVTVAHNIEAEVLNTPTGTQDYYPAASGGVNILQYSYSGISHEVLSVDHTDLANYFLLVHTGKAHHSGINNFEVMKKAVNKDHKTIHALIKLKEIAEETAKVSRAGRWTQLPALFRDEYKWRIELSPTFSSPEIEKLAELSLQAGAEAVKICGAGGGGCVLIWCPPSQREGVTKACQAAGFPVLAAKPVAPLTI